MKKLLITLFSCILFIQGNFAQTSLQAPLPMDPNVIIGKLPNGITYYLRHNAEPKERASFYIIRDAGAVLETDEQDGLAHFLEHMAFNGTKNFPDKGIITTLERHGVAFGRNVNAYTAHNETVYNLSAVPTNNPALLDTCLLILHDWSHYLTLNEKEIDNERGVISEEWRTRRNSRFRIQGQTFSALFKGSRYADRDVIGELDVIKNFKYQEIRDFYHKWYRTDLEAIAIVGDFDVKEMEEKVKKVFSPLPAVENPEPRPFIEIPNHEEINYVLATDKEAQHSSVSIMTRLNAPSAQDKNTHAYLKNNIIMSFYNGMIRFRIAELMQQANPPFLNGSIGYGGLVRGYHSYNVATTAKPNEEALALETILRENEKIKRFGFTTGELNRLKINMLTSLESAIKDKDKTNNEAYIKEMISHFLEKEPIVDFDYYYAFAKQIIPTITVEEVNAKAKEWNQTANRTIVISGPSENAIHLTKEEVIALINKVNQATDIEPYRDQTTSTSLIEEELKGSKVVATKELPQFNGVEWKLANGAVVVFRKADYEKDDVTLVSYSKGGTSLYEVDMLVSASNTAAIAAASGLSNFNTIELNKALTGKMASTKVSIGALSESVNGASTPKDFETMLQLIYLRFEKPRFDKDIFASVMNRNWAMLPNQLKNPQKIMQDSLQLIMSNYHPRTLIYNEEYLKQLSLEKIEQIYRDRIKDASDFTFFIVGNIDAETVKPLVEKYIGSIKSEQRKENWKDRGVRGPKGKTEKEIEIALEVPKATVITSVSKDMKYNMYNNFCNSILKGVLDLRYTENIREKEGGTYGVSVQASSSREPYSKYGLSISFDCDPEKAHHLKSLVYAELEKMTKEAPTQEEFNKIILNMKKNREQSKNHNKYWLNAIYSYYLTGINSADPKHYEEILDKLTPKDIQKFAKALYNKKTDIVDIIFKPKAK